MVGARCHLNWADISSTNHRFDSQGNDTVGEAKIGRVHITIYCACE